MSTYTLHATFFSLSLSVSTLRETLLPPVPMDALLRSNTLPNVLSPLCLLPYYQHRHDQFEIHTHQGKSKIFLQLLTRRFLFQTTIDNY